MKVTWCEMGCWLARDIFGCIGSSETDHPNGYTKNRNFLRLDNKKPVWNLSEAQMKAQDNQFRILKNAIRQIINFFPEDAFKNKSSINTKDFEEAVRMFRCGDYLTDHQRIRLYDHDALTFGIHLNAVDCFFRVEIERFFQHSKTEQYKNEVAMGIEGPPVQDRFKKVRQLKLFILDHDAQQTMEEIVSYLTSFGLCVVFNIL